MIDEYTKLFQQQCYKHFEPLIDDYNSLITNPSFASRITECLSILKNHDYYTAKDIKKITTSAKEEFSPINIEH